MDSHSVLDDHKLHGGDSVIELIHKTRLLYMYISRGEANKEQSSEHHYSRIYVYFLISSVLSGEKIKFLII